MSGRISVAAAIAPAEFFKAQSALQLQTGPLSNISWISARFS